MQSSFRKSFLMPVLVLASFSVMAGSSFSISPFFARPSDLSDTGSNLSTQTGVALHAPIVLHGSLVSFEAEYGRSFFDLNWNTRSESLFDHFELERSIDGIHFNKVGEIKAMDVTSGEQNYSFRDNIRPVLARKNDLYYRLKQVEPNGGFNYSKVLIARMYNSTSVASLSVTPDPVVNDIIVNVQLKENSYVVMKVKDRDGNELLNNSVHGLSGSNSYQLDATHKLAAGEYQLEVIINSHERMVVKLIKG
jgi:hypothetical protein